MKKLIQLLIIILLFISCGKEKYSTTFNGKISPEVLDGKIKLEITANVPDGAILETTLVGYKGKEPAFNVQNIVIKDGKGEFLGLFVK